MLLWKASPEEAVGAPAFAPSDSLTRLALRRFLRHRFALLGTALLLLMILSAAGAPVIGGYSPIKTDIRGKLQAPSLAHPMGTDHFGRDVFSRMLHGTRISLAVGLQVVVVAGLIGTLLGLVSGFLGGWTDNVIMRLMDAFLTFPPLLLAVAIMGTLGPEIRNVMLALALVYTPVFARLVRGNTLALREETYVTAARAVGASPWRIILRHILPNIFSPIVVFAAVTLSRAILAEASLSFLGLGVQPPFASWGRDLNEARRFLETSWWLVAFPTGMIGISVLSMNFIGDGLRDALDPRSTR